MESRIFSCSFASRFTFHTSLHLLPSLEDQADILATEPERVGHGERRACGSRGARNAVKGNLWIRMVEVGGGRDQPMSERQRRGDRFQSAGRGHGVTDE